MIDTVVLTLQDHQFQIVDPSQFKPNAWQILEVKQQRLQGEQHRKAVCNPSKHQQREGPHKPRLTLHGRRYVGGSYSVTLKVECSIPKLLFGNNFQELTGNELLEVCETLSDRMAEMGVYCHFYELQQATVSAIHYGKNIILNDYVTCGSVLRELSKVDVKAWFDFSKTDFRNNGHLYKIHSNEFELVFYDKIKDLKKAVRSPKRALEQDQVLQQSLLNRKDFSTEQQVLRVEARFGSRRKLKSTLEKLGLFVGHVTKMTFEALYSLDLARRLLLHQWKPFRKALSMITASAGQSVATLFEQIRAVNPSMTDGAALKLLAAHVLVDDIGWPGLKSVWKGSTRTLSRLKADTEALGLSNNVAFKGFSQVSHALECFEPITQFV